MTLYVIDQLIDARGLAHHDVMRRTRDAVNGLLGGQTAEVLTTDPDSLPDIVGWVATRPVEMMEATVDHGLYRVVLRHT